MSVKCVKFNGLNYDNVSCDQIDAFVLITRTEYQSSLFSLFNLSPESAAEIGGAALLIMSVAFIFRQIQKYLSDESE